MTPKDLRLIYKFQTSKNASRDTDPLSSSPERLSCDYKEWLEANLVDLINVTGKNIE